MLADEPPDVAHMRSLSERPVFSAIIVWMAASQSVHLVVLDRDGTLIDHDGVVAAAEPSRCGVARWT